ncbi:EAL domain-containing protein [Marinobacter salsuginis]|uniref:EAL domain-containing protein n=1 Tax=Marinobacter salsuginis TaxID=418719 RepID=UPI00273D7B20|nr:EAL domain-containing protein [Marinobacter salsuginis]
MDDGTQQTEKAVLSELRAQSRLTPFRRWLPFLFLFAAMAYGLVAALLHQHANPLSPLPHVDAPASAPQSPRIVQIDYLAAPLEQVIDDENWRRQNWQAAPSENSGIGYYDTPVTFKVTVENPGTADVEQWALVSAPYIDRLRPAILDENGVFQRLREMGDIYPFGNRLVSLPPWIWPVSLPTGTSTLLFEVQNTGPTLLPITIMEPNNVVSSIAGTMAWKAFITGLLVFALLLNLSFMMKFRLPGLAWLGVLTLSVIHVQLVMEGFGLWLIWPNLPEVNALLNISLCLCLISLCQITPNFIQVSRLPRLLLNATSVLGLLHLLAMPLQLPLLGQDSFLILALAGGSMILALALKQARHEVYARYFALSLLCILLGTVISAARTVGWVPVNSFTDSAFFIGAAAASLILTSGIGRQILEERKKRRNSDIRARQERKLRSHVEQNYKKLLKTHSVTGKPNRAMLEESLDQFDSQQRPYTVAMIQLTRFNEIEQALGYRTAEDLLRSYLWELDGFLKRIMGDRLIMVDGYALASIDTSNHAFAFYQSDTADTDTEKLKTIVNWLGENFREGRFSLSWSPSVGIAHAPEHGVDASAILSSAGFAALNTHQSLTVYDPAIADLQYQQQMLMLDIEEALGNGCIWLEYQPTVRIEDASIASLEALIRWQHPDFGTVAPDRWIPLAEQVGMIHHVTLWVVDRVCEDMSALKSRHGDHIAVAVNISANDLTYPDFLENVKGIVQRHGAQPSDLILEITETAMMADTALAQEVIRTLSHSGFRIAVDDFGTGHSSLGTLATFELDELKIDRSFLSGILTQPARQRIFRAALDLGEALELDVVIEGVEEEAIAAWLQQFPGLYGQGYYWGKPEPLKS